jgi:arylsulfatase A-like enzyme
LALLTSLPDMVHGVLDESNLLDENRITLAEMMKENGYKTFGIFTGPFLLPRWGYGQGFDAYLDLTIFDRELDGAEMLNASERGRTTLGALKKAEELINQNSGKPFFLFLHLFDVHPDFDPPPPYDNMFDPDYRGSIHGIDIMNNPDIHKNMPSSDLDHLKALYDGEIRFIDEAGIAQLIDIIEENGVIDNTLIVITSDHGEEFFEHGVFGHRQNLFDTTLRIPLILWCPKLIPPGRVVKDQVRIIDIMPTILELIGLPQSPEGIGESLVSLFNGKGKKKRPVFTTLKDWKVYLEALRTNEYKIIRDYMREERTYFDLLIDPEEIIPFTDQNKEEFKKAMDKFFSIRFNLSSLKKVLPWSHNVAPKIDPELLQRLKSLGYLKDH